MSLTVPSHFFLFGKLGVHYIWYQGKGYNTWTLNRAKNGFLVQAILFNEKPTKALIITNIKKKLFYCDNGSTEQRRDPN